MWIAKKESGMAKRKNLTKTIRFEVFKRDSFTCQYCGKVAPDVVLEVDHILPVVEGGTNELINLVTSCFDCNRGKGKRRLNNTTTLKSERVEIEKLKKRKEQMTQYVEWKKELLNVNSQEFDMLNDSYGTTGYYWNEKGKRLVMKLIRKYGFKECYDSLDICIEQYDPDKCDMADKLTKILGSRKRAMDNPHLKDVYYIRAIVKNRMHCNEWKAKDLIEAAILNGCDVESLKEIAKTESNWTSWRDTMEGVI